MSKSKQLNKMANLVMQKGASAEEAVELINQSDYAKAANLKIEKETLNNVQSIDALIEDLPGMRQVANEYKTQIDHHQNFSKAAMELKQSQILLNTGWDVFKGVKWMSGVYLIMLTVIISILQIFVMPTFVEIFSNFGATLPALTQLFFTDENIINILLITFWALTLGNMWVVLLITKNIKKFELLPTWSLRIPIIGSICHIINQCMSLSIYKFLLSFESFVLPTQEKWHETFELSVKDKKYQWADEQYQLLKLALELNIADEYIQTELDKASAKYIETTAQSMKLLSTIGSILLALFIGATVIAMYLPIFSMGQVVG